MTEIDQNVNDKYSIKELAFIEGIMRGLYVNVAYQKAGYKPDTKNPYRKFREPKIQREIKRRQAEQKDMGGIILFSDIDQAAREYKTLGEIGPPETKRKILERRLTTSGVLPVEKQQIEMHGDQDINVKFRIIRPGDKIDEDEAG